jgi:hypothetical protein
MTTIQKIWSKVHNRHAYYDENGNRFPEICIIDLAKLPKELLFFDVEETIQIWEWIKENIRNMIKSETEEFFLVSREYIGP